MLHQRLSQARINTEGEENQAVLFDNDKIVPTHPGSHRGPQKSKGLSSCQGNAEDVEKHFITTRSYHGLIALAAEACFVVDDVSIGLPTSAFLYPMILHQAQSFFFPFSLH